MAGFGTDRVLLYDVKPWNTLGFGAPNFGENVGTLNITIAGLVDEIGRNQLFLMTHIDATREKPPSRNVVERICKMVMRVETILGGRSKAYNERRLEPGHVTPAQRAFNIHPCPFFNSQIARNHWMCEYNNLVMVALSNMMQHSDNVVALNVTKELADDVWQYFLEIRILVGRELLLIRGDELADPAVSFQFTDEHYDTYDPMSVVTNTEALETPTPVFELFTEDDLRRLARGIPAPDIKPLLKQYPVFEDDPTGLGGTSVGTEASIAGGAGGAGRAPPQRTRPSIVMFPTKPKRELQCCEGCGRDCYGMYCRSCCPSTSRRPTGGNGWRRIDSTKSRRWKELPE